MIPRLIAAALTLTLLLPGLAPAQPETQRLPIYEPSGASPGTLFSHTEALLVADQPAEAEEIKLLGGPENYQRFAAGFQRLDADGLAENYLRSFGGAQSTAVQMDTFRRVFEGKPDMIRRLTSTESIVHLPDGSTLSFPMASAPVYHRAVGRIAARLLKGKTVASVAGAYAASASGECPNVAGPVDVVQQGFVFEGKSAYPLLWGAVGKMRAWILANEVLYMTVRRDARAGIRIEAPDAVQEVYSATLGRPSLVLTGMQYKTCTITLVPRP